MNSFKPIFKETEGTYKWSFIECDNAFSDGEKIAVKGEYEANVGQAIEFNQDIEFSNKKGLVIWYGEGLTLRYNRKQSNISSIYPHILRVENDKTVSQLDMLRNFSFAGEFGVVTYQTNNNKKENNLYGKKIMAIGDSMVRGHTLKENQTWLRKISK